jgi:hypothetical protein
LRHPQKDVAVTAGGRKSGRQQKYEVIYDEDISDFPIIAMDDKCYYYDLREQPKELQLETAPQITKSDEPITVPEAPTAPPTDVPSPDRRGSASADPEVPQRPEPSPLISGEYVSLPVESPPDMIEA